MKQPYHNDTDKFLHIGGVSIPPHQTRDVDSAFLPKTKTPEEKPEQVDPLAQILDSKVADVVAGLADLSDEELHRLEALEQEGKNRQGVLAGITHELLSRAEQAAAGANSEDQK